MSKFYDVIRIIMWGGFVKEKQGELREVLEAQKQLLARYETIVTNYETSDLVIENKKLREEINELRANNRTLIENCKKAREEALAAKSALHEQVLSERIRFIDKSKEKVEIYFKEECHETLDQLTKLEQKLKGMVNTTDQRLLKEIGDDLEWHKKKLMQLNQEIEEAVKSKKRELGEQLAQIEREIKLEYRKLKEATVSKEVLEKRIKANHLEVKIGLNWVNKAGMFLILIGIVTAMSYSFKYFFSDIVKGIFGLALGIALLLGGEYCARKDC